MPQQLTTTVENNFSKGLLTEFTGLNFPENGATDCDNIEFTLIGDVLRRLGLDYEDNSNFTSIATAGGAINGYKWNNAGGDGSLQLLVIQIGGTLHFYNITASTPASPLSNNKLASTVDLTALASSFDATVACEFTDGNGYLFIFHPDSDPIFCSYSAGVITGSSITVQIRDFAGITETDVADNDRPSSLTTSHQYNLQNQGWIAGNPWSATSSSTVTVGTGAKVFTIQAGLTITPGQTVRVVGLVSGHPSDATMTGTVTSYSVTTLTLSITSTTSLGTLSNWSIVPIIVSQITTWNTAIGNYPSNADQWWRFKNASRVFDPATTNANTSIGLGSAPRGHYLLNAFNQTRTSVSGIPGLTDITTTMRPTNGCWFQGRVWYSGINGSQQASGTASYTTWTENIYFSRVVQNPTDFGKCYQTNDPTSEELFDLLPTDGGVLVIQGCGVIFKLFPTVNGLLVHTQNGWFYITGSQGIGFAANDYTITKISGIQGIGLTSYVDVQGLPYFWNEEGIYSVEADQQGRLQVNSLTFSSIDTFYGEIPKRSKLFVRGTYNPIDYVIQWVYSSTASANVTSTFTFDKALNYNVRSKAFFPYTFDTTLGKVHSVNYITGPGSVTDPAPAFKYFSSSGNNTAFADLNDGGYAEWASQGGVDTDGKSFLITGYKLHGKALMKFEVPYIYVFSRLTNGSSGFKLQSIWDYSNTPNTGRWSNDQTFQLYDPHYDVSPRKIKLRGRGLALQLKFKSIAGIPFDCIGWSAFEAINQGI